jgi:hypothetical protein
LAISYGVRFEIHSSGQQHDLFEHCWRHSEPGKFRKIPLVTQTVTLGRHGSAIIGGAGERFAEALSIACVKGQKPDKVCQTLMAAMSYMGGSGAIAPYSAERVEWRLPPGTYVAACFVPNMMNMPHAALGMVTVFVVQARDTDGD